jgi:hypothetical protein
MESTMVMIMESAGRETPRDILGDGEEDEFDGWGPVRPRRSSAPLSADPDEDGNKMPAPIVDPKQSP